jgi:hypothetical protein
VTPRRATWRATRWLVLGALASAGFVLGFWGFLENESVSDAAYQTLKLVNLGGAPDAGGSWQIEIARFVLPLVLAYSAIVAFLAVFRDRLRELRLPWLRGHTIVVGLGDKGTAFVHSLRAHGARVVAIETNPASVGAAAARELGVVLLTGDARDPVVLRAAGARHARTVLAVSGDDSVNAEVALTSRGIALEADSLSEPRCIAHIDDPGLALLLRVDNLRRGAAGSEIDYFSVDEYAARVIVRRYVTVPDRGPAGRVVLVGATTLLHQLLCACVDETSPDVPLTLVNPGDGRHPSLDDLPPALQDGDVEVQQLSGRPVGASGSRLCSPGGVVIIDLDDDGASLEAALTLRESAQRTGTTIVACVRGSQGLERVMSDARGENLDRLHAHSVLAETCTAELLFELGVYDTLARVAHEEYVRSRLELGEAAAHDPALVPWDQLSEALRESNRMQARDIGHKLRTLGYGIAPLAWNHEDPVVLSPEEIEVLAKAEHERWCAERTRAGWELAPERDHGDNRSPYLKPWDELDESVRDRDRTAVRAIPEQLRRAGARIARPTASR